MGLSSSNGSEGPVAFIPRNPLTVLLGFPHRLTEDNIYNGYFIPVGSLVFANIWYAQTLSLPLFKAPLTMCIW